MVSRSTRSRKRSAVQPAAQSHDLAERVYPAPPAVKPAKVPPPADPFYAKFYPDPRPNLSRPILRAVELVGMLELAEAAAEAIQDEGPHDDIAYGTWCNLRAKLTECQRQAGEILAYAAGGQALRGWFQGKNEK